MFPPSPQQWLAENHLAHFISDLVEELDISELQKRYSRDYRGQRPYDLRMMLKILIYGYCTGVYSSRRLEKKLQEDVAFIYLAAGQQPDNRRAIRQEPISGSLHFTGQAGLVGRSHGSLAAALAVPRPLPPNLLRKLANSSCSFPVLARQQHRYRNAASCDTTFFLD